MFCCSGRFCTFRLRWHPSSKWQCVFQQKDRIYGSSNKLMLEPQSHEQRNENKTSEAFHGQAATFIIAWADTNYCSKIPALALAGLQPWLEISLLCSCWVDGYSGRWWVLIVHAKYKNINNKSIFSNVFTKIKLVFNTAAVHFFVLLNIILWYFPDSEMLWSKELLWQCISNLFHSRVRGKNIINIFFSFTLFWYPCTQQFFAPQKNNLNKLQCQRNL